MPMRPALRRIPAPCLAWTPLARPAGAWPTCGGKAKRRGSPLAGTLLGLGLSLGLVAAASSAAATPGPSVAIPNDAAFIPLMRCWGQAAAQDLGLRIQWQAMAEDRVAPALAQGDVSNAIFLATPQADRLQDAGLIYDRHTLAVGDIVLVGPKDDQAGIRGLTRAAEVLAQVQAAAAAGAIQWQAPQAGSAVQAWSQSVWSGPALTATPASTPGAHVGGHVGGHYALLRADEWRNARQAKLAGPRLWLQADAALHLDLARSLRLNHPAAGLLQHWLQGPLGQSCLRQAGAQWRTSQAPKPTRERQP